MTKKKKKKKDEKAHAEQNRHAMARWRSEQDQREMARWWEGGGGSSGEPTIRGWSTLAGLTEEQRHALVDLAQAELAADQAWEKVDKLVAQILKGRAS